MTGTGRSARPEPWLLPEWVEKSAFAAVGAGSRASSAGQRSRGSGDDPLTAVRDLLDRFHAAEWILRVARLEEARGVTPAMAAWSSPAPPGKRAGRGSFVS